MCSSPNLESSPRASSCPPDSVGTGLASACASQPLIFADFMEQSRLS